MTTWIALAVVAAFATTARAGDATRVQIELPPDILFVEPGQRVDVVQVVGLDADGKRVGFGGVTPVLTATAGEIESVAPPYRFAYTAPATIDGPLAVTLEARLPGTAAARGTLRLDVLPPGPYVRLRVDADVRRLEWAGSTIFSIRGETREGRVVPVADRKVDVTADGPGTVEFVRLGSYRFVAPDRPDPDGRTSVVLRARVQRDAAVHGELTLSLGPVLPRRDPAASTTAEPVESPPPPTVETTPSPATGGSASDAPPQEVAERSRGGTDPGTSPADTVDNADTVDWPGGRLRLTAWRVKGGAEGEKGRRMRRLPEPGAEVLASAPEQRLRFVVLDGTVSDVTAATRRGGADGERADDRIDLRVKPNKAGKLTVVIDARTPADGTPLHVTLTLTRDAGDPSTDVVVLRRRARDRAR